MDSENSFVKKERYQAYVNATTEKILLRQYLQSEFCSFNLSIRPFDSSKKVLDLGSGTGATLRILEEVFAGHDVSGVERSAAQLAAIPDASVEHRAFEDHTGKYDFILASHVLQYIDTDPRSFIKKIYESLSVGGEAWIVQQTRQGMYEIIQPVKELLPDNRFRKEWLTFEDYVQMVDGLQLPYQTHVLPTSIEGIDFKNPSREEQLRLEFMLCLSDGYQSTDKEIKQRLSYFPTQQRILHPKRDN